MTDRISVLGIFVRAKISSSANVVVTMYNINYIRITSLRFLINARMYDCMHALKQVPRLHVVTAVLHLA